MSLLLTTFVVALGSALLPFINIEIYLGGISGASGVADVTGWGAVGIALVASAGQTAGKVVWYEVARRGIDTDWARKKLSNNKLQAAHARWTERMEGRPWYAGVVMLLAASVGIPPLLVMAVVAGALKMPLWVFVPTVFVGRAARFYLILVGVDLLFH
mgnify:CR=1 FL=1